MHVVATDSLSKIPGVELQSYPPVEKSFLKKAAKVMKTVDVVLVNIIYPIALLITSLIRLANLFSLVYFLGFLTIILWPLHVLFNRRAWVIAHVSITCFVSFLGLLGQVLYQAVFYSKPSLLERSFEKNALELAGFTKLSYNVQGARFVIADAALMIVTIILLLRLRASGNEDEEELKTKREEYIQSFKYHALRSSVRFTYRAVSYIGLCFLLLIGASYPSILSAPYLLIFMFSMLKIRSQTIISLVQSSWIVLLLYNSFYLVAAYIYQLAPVNQGIETDTNEDTNGRILGLAHYDRLEITDWPIITGYALSIALFIMLAKWYRVCQVSSYVEQNDSEGKSNFFKALDNRAVNALPSAELKIASFLVKHGWKICLAALLYEAFLIPSLLGLVILVVLCVGLVVPEEHAAKVPPFVLVYLIFSILLQYAYNISFDSQQTDLLTDIGLVKQYYSWFVIGSQCLVVFIIAIYWMVQTYVPYLDPSKQRLRRNSKGSIRFQLWFMHFLRSTPMLVLRELCIVAFNFTIDNSYLVSLAGLYVAGLTEVTVLNAGYMVFFIFFVISKKLAKQFWVYLVIYSELVVVLYYLYQFNFSAPWQEKTPALFGLRTYKQLWYGILWNIVIMVFSVIQWRLNNVKSLKRITTEDVIIETAEEDKLKRRSTKLLSQSDGALPVNAFKLKTPHIFKILGEIFQATVNRLALPICYLALLLVGVLDTLSFFSLFYIIFLFVCLIAHLLAAKAEKFLKGIWTLLVVGSGVILISRYMYQFQGVESYMKDNLLADGGSITLKDVGFQVYDVRTLFRVLLPDTAVLVLAVFQFLNFFEHLYFPEIDWPVKLMELVEFCKRFLILHSSKMTVFVIWYVVVQTATAFHFIYALLLILSIFFPRGPDDFGLVFLIYSQLIMLAQMCFNFPAVDPYRSETTAWIGFRQRTNLWFAVDEQILIMCFLFIQRFSYRLDKREGQVSLFILQDSIRRDSVENGLRVNEEQPLLDIAKASTITKWKWYISNFYTLFGYQIFIIILMFSLCTRYTILGIVWLVILALILMSHKRGYHERGQPVLVVLFVFTLVVQYFFALGLPPAEELTYPWVHSRVSEAYQEWLLIDVPNLKALTIDFLVLYFAVLLWNVPAHEKVKASAMESKVGEADAERFKAAPKSGANAIRFFLFRNSSEVILVFMFIAGTSRADVLSLGYVAFSLYFLFNSNHILFRKDLVWRWARMYNFFLVFLQLLFQAPFMPDSDDPASWQSIIGLEKIQLNVSAIISNGLLFDLIIMVLLRLQKKLSRRKELTVVRDIIKSDQENAYKLAQEYFQEKELKEQESAAMAEEEKLNRWKRMLDVKQKRKERYHIEDDEGELRRKFQLLETDARNSGSPLEKRASRSSTPIAPGTPKTEEHDQQPVESSSSEEDKLETSTAPAPAPEPSKLNKLWSKIKSLAAKAVDYLFVAMESSLKFKKRKDIPQSKVKRFFTTLLLVVEQQSKNVCILMFVINHAVYSSVLSMFYPLVGFGYAILLEEPKPSKLFWNIVLYYTNALIVIKYLFQISLFCLCHGPHSLSYNVYPTCASQLECGYVVQQPGITYPYLIGITKFQEGLFISGIFWDLAVLLAVYWHRSVLRSMGLWDYSLQDSTGQTVGSLVDDKLQEEDKLSVEHQPTPTIRDELKEPTPVTAVHVEKDLNSPRIDSTDTISPVESPGIEPEETIDPDEEENQDPEQHTVDIPNKDENDEESTLHKIKKIALKALYPFVEVIYFSSKETGKDYYMAIFVIDLLSFIYLVLFQQEFTGVATAQVSQYLSASFIPISYLGILICQFGLILVERVIYLYHSHKAKLVMQLVSLAFYHCILFFYLPIANNKSFSNSPGLIVFYLLKCCYFFFSGLQINGGYAYSGTRFLTRKVNDVREIVFIVYRAIPFVFELKTLLDWIVTDTSLIFRNFLKLEDLYAELFLVKCFVVNGHKPDRKIGDKQPWWIKALQGVSMFVGLVFLIWFPLLLLSSGNPGNKPNLYYRATISVGVQGYQPLFTRDQNQPSGSISGSLFNKIRNQNSGILGEEQRDTQLLTLQTFSDTQWQPTPPAQKNMENYLLQSSGAILQTQISFTRDNPPTRLTTAMPFSHTLTLAEQTGLAAVIAGNQSYVIIYNLMPRFIRIPLTDDIQFVTSLPFVSANFSLNRIVRNATSETGEEIEVYNQWWTVTQIETDDLFTSSEIEIVTISAETVPSYLSSFAVSGLIGLYVGVVLSVGRFLRMWVSGLITRIYLEDMPNVDGLLRMCEDIFIARYYKDLILEEELYRELIELFRSPERLIEKTKKS